MLYYLVLYQKQITKLLKFKNDMKDKIFSLEDLEYIGEIFKGSWRHNH